MVRSVLAPTIIINNNNTKRNKQQHSSLFLDRFAKTRHNPRTNTATTAGSITATCYHISRVMPLILNTTCTNEKCQSQPGEINTRPPKRRDRAYPYSPTLPSNIKATMDMPQKHKLTGWKGSTGYVQSIIDRTDQDVVIRATEVFRVGSWHGAVGCQ